MIKAETIAAPWGLSNYNRLQSIYRVPEIQAKVDGNIQPLFQKIRRACAFGEQTSAKRRLLSQNRHSCLTARLQITLWYCILVYFDYSSQSAANFKKLSARPFPVNTATVRLLGLFRKYSFLFCNVRKTKRRSVYLVNLPLIYLFLKHHLNMILLSNKSLMKKSNCDVNSPSFRWHDQDFDIYSLLSPISELPTKSSDLLNSWNFCRYLV